MVHVTLSLGNRPGRSSARGGGWFYPGGRGKLLSRAAAPGVVSGGLRWSPGPGGRAGLWYPREVPAPGLAAGRCVRLSSPAGPAEVRPR